MPKSNKEEAVATASPKAAFIAVAIGGILLAATIAAYLGRIPTEIRAIPFYDSIGHFALFGTLAAALDRVFRERMMRGIPVAAWSVGSYAILDESLQSLSSMRTFSFGDLAAGLIGIGVLTVIGRSVYPEKGIRESAARELRK